MSFKNLFIKYFGTLCDVVFWIIPVLAIIFRNIGILDYDLIVASLEGLIYFFENLTYSKVKAVFGLLLFFITPVVFFIVH